MSVSHETSKLLDAYAALLRKWSSKINLIAPKTVRDLQHRHIVDSQQLVDLSCEATTWCDLGSGGGLPGLVVSICWPSLAMRLIEADTRKCVFLQTVVRELDLNATVLNMRIEDAPPQSADAVSARALAPLEHLIPLAFRHGHPGTKYIFPKGARYKEELEVARQRYRFDVDVRPSITDKEAVILVLENVRGVD